METSTIIISLAITGAILLLQNRRKRRFAAGFRIKADAAFARLLCHPDNADQAPTGSSVEIVREKEEIESSRGVPLAYVLTRIARMPAGNYCFFMFRSDATPYCKHLDDATARVLLGAHHISKPGRVGGSVINKNGL